MLHDTLLLLKFRGSLFNGRVKVLAKDSGIAKKLKLCVYDDGLQFSWGRRILKIEVADLIVKQKLGRGLSALQRIHTPSISHLKWPMGHYKLPQPN